MRLPRRFAPRNDYFLKSFTIDRFVIAYQDHDYIGKTSIFYPAIVWKGKGGVKKKGKRNGKAMGESLL
jgi:hypothetical protein